MLLPSKITSFKESSLWVAYQLCKIVATKPHGVLEIVHEFGKLNNASISDVVIGLDILFALNKVEISEGRITYVG